MGQTCCPMWAYVDAATWGIMDNSWDQIISDFPYCQLFECNPVYCAAVGL